MIVIIIYELPTFCGKNLRVRGCEATFPHKQKLCGFGQYASRASFFVVVRL